MNSINIDDVGEDEDDDYSSDGNGICGGDDNE